MTSDELLQIITEHSLTIRCLPKIVITLWQFRPGDEEKFGVGIPLYDNIGNITRTIVQKGDKKYLQEEKTVEKAGWWYVEHTPHTDSIVRFSKYSFLAPTLEEAIMLYLKSKQ